MSVSVNCGACSCGLARGACRGGGALLRSCDSGTAGRGSSRGGSGAGLNRLLLLPALHECRCWNEFVSAVEECGLSTLLVVVVVAAVVVAVFVVVVVAR